MTTAWNAWIDQARAVDILTVATTLGAVLKRTGVNEYEGPCPMCGGRDRFSVNTKKGVFNCRVCAAKGDAIDLVQIKSGCHFVEACESLTGRSRPDRSRDETPDERKQRLAQRAAYEAKLKKIDERRQSEEAFLEHAIQDASLTRGGERRLRFALQVTADPHAR